MICHKEEFDDTAGRHSGGTGRLRRRFVSVSLLIVAGLAVSTASAWASSTGWTGATQTVSGKAQFSGSYKWYSNGDNHGGFEIKGTLHDLNKSNDRGVKFQVKVEGYSPTTYKAETDKDRSIPDLVHYSPDETLTSYVKYQTCQVNTVSPDDCTAWVRENNPYK
jgi:hypothetical protein